MSGNFRPAALIVAMVFCACFARVALAGNHALLIANSEYTPADNSLPSVALDVDLARRIAIAMRVPAGNITIARNLSATDMVRAMVAFTSSLKPGDNAFFYYSGHGTRWAVEAEPGKCSEGLVGSDSTVIADVLLQRWIGQTAERAQRLVLMIDSCFSGGAAEYRGIDEKPKFYKSADTLPCSKPVNTARSLVEQIAGTRDLQSNVVYIAAARDNEVALATGKGSLATLRWADCIDSPAADTDGSGAISALELNACAQAKFDQYFSSNPARAHHATIVGNSQALVSFPVASTAPVATAAVSATAAVLPVLTGLQRSADARWKVSVATAQPAHRVGIDPVRFIVTTSEPGYLTLLYLGSDGRTIDILFPNGLDQDNLLAAGTHELPRPAWRIRAQGPVGEDHILAIVSATNRDFTALRRGSAGPFTSIPAETSQLRNLSLEMIEPSAPCGAGPCSTRFGAALATIREVAP